MEKEIRQYNIEFRTTDERVVEGRAIPFNIPSPNREGFRETILPEAVAGVFEKSDVFMVYNHDRSKGFLARAKNGNGSLKIDVREDGVYFSFEALHDDLSNYIYERLKRGDLDEMSWAFTVESDTWTKAADGVYDRTINKFDHIYDLSVVDQSYYGIANAVSARFAEIQEQDRLENEARMKEEEERIEAEKRAEEEAAKAEEEAKAEQERKEKLEQYYKSIRDSYAEALKHADELNGKAGE